MPEDSDYCPPVDDTPPPAATRSASDPRVTGTATFDRASMISRLRQGGFDVVVVGGGITGVGVALDAASRGLRTALVERDDFASGTSSKSSKLVHGGLRYLQQGDVRLVYEALHERQRLYRNAPHLVTVLPFMLPILTKDGLVSRKIARALGSALWMYDITGGLRIGRVHSRLRRKRALAHMPTMPPERLASAYVYYDAQADDARLCLTVARTAADHGAVVVNRCAMTSVVRTGERVTGITVRCDGETFDVDAAVVVNATGVFTDQLDVVPAKGVHITVPWDKVRNDIAVVIPVPKDRRSLFVVPWGPRGDGTFTHTYVGTTDTGYRGPVEDPQCTKDDIDYVLRALNASVTTGITEADITGVWAGLRPLVKAVSDDRAAARTADLSRRHLVKTSDDGIVTVNGGKLTTYREMASDTVDQVVKTLGRRARSRTKRLRLHGARGHRSKPGHSIDETTARHLSGRYGGEAHVLAAMIERDPSLGEPMVPSLPYTKAEAVYAVTHEMATTLDDVLSRRTRALLFDRAAARLAAADVARLMAPHAGWDDARVALEVAAFEEICTHEEVAAQVTESEMYP